MPTSPTARRASLMFLVAALMALSSGASAQVEQAGQFGDWQMACQVTEEATGDDLPGCFLVQNLFEENSGQRLLHVRLGIAPDDGAPVVLMNLPLGILLTQGIRMQVDEGEVFGAPVLFCEQNGCRAQFKLTPEVRAAFERGERTKVQLRGARSGAVIALWFSLRGISAGLAELELRQAG